LIFLLNRDKIKHYYFLNDWQQKINQRFIQQKDPQFCLERLFYRYSAALAGETGMKKIETDRSHLLEMAVVMLRMSGS